jgi:NAD-dependent DNA ligase
LNAALKSFGDKTAEAIIEGFVKFREWVDENNFAPPRYWASSSFKKALIKVVLTGFRDQVLESKILEFGGSIETNVTKATTVLVAADTSVASGKILKARSLGIPVVSRSEFVFSEYM